MPDFRTINALRKGKLDPVINEVFVELVKLLHNQGYVELDTLYVDGTKIESRANRYTFVWKRAIDHFDNRLEDKVREYLEEVKRIADEEDLRYGEKDLPEMGDSPVSHETIAEMAAKINETIEKLSDNEDKTVKKNWKKFTRFLRMICCRENRNMSTTELSSKGGIAIPGPILMQLS